MTTQGETGGRERLAAAQKALSQRQLEAFNHDQFVEDQVRHFTALVTARKGERRTVVDVGGGHGFFAGRLARAAGCSVRVIDTDPASVEACRQAGIEAVLGDALDARFVGEEELVCFNLILHHLIGDSERATSELQRKALALWRGHARAVFVNEYIYESYLPGFSGWLIFQVTRSRVLSRLGQLVSVAIPSLRANTFGVGVRFREEAQWRRLFAAAGFRVVASVRGEEEPVSLSRRLLLIRSIRRDSYLLEPLSA